MPDFPYPAPNQWPSGGQWPFDAPDPPPRITLAGSLDPTTGIFYRTPEHPRLRTAQACEKCRSRKAKCSGDHPSCARCLARGLACEYAKEGRVRGPNKPKSRAGSNESTSSQRSQSPAPLLYTSPVNLTARRRRRNASMPTTGGGVKLEPLSSCVPLSLPSSSSSHSVHGSINGPTHLSIDTSGKLHRPVPLNAHLGSGAANRFSQSASLSLSSLSAHDTPHTNCSSSSSSQALATLSSTYDPSPMYADSSSYSDPGYPNAAYVNANSQRCEPLFGLDRPQAANRGYDHYDAQGYMYDSAYEHWDKGYDKYAGAGEGLDAVDHRSVLPLGTGSTLPAHGSTFQSAMDDQDDFADTGRGVPISHTRACPGVSLNMGLASGLAVRRARSVMSLSRSLSDGSGRTSSGSGSGVDAESAPASASSGSFPLFRAQWPYSNPPQSQPHSAPEYSYSPDSYSPISLSRPPAQSPYSPHTYSPHPHRYSPY